jgi:pimeloyl-ACP methyl ester carboxylesterase|tara:strand:- start:611 stop:1789 length:1179 start_codon:yes stop_codon:yes gene_type:complete
MSHIKFLTFFFFFFLTVSCDDFEIVPAHLDTYLKLYTQDKGQVMNAVQNSLFDDITKYINYGVSLYTITYNTTYKGENIKASGLVAFPETTNNVPILNFNHGTTSLHRDAPTEDLFQYIFFSNAASAGYIFVIPDYLGFGVSDDILHPYYRSDITGSTIVDMLRATKELAEIEGYNFNGDVFLSGYSEGGFATMSAHKTLEENNFQGLNLVASAPAAGGYDMTGMLNYFLSLDTYHQPYYLAYVAFSYKTSYDWELPLTDIFNEPYASLIPQYFNGQYSGGEINSVLSYSVDLLLNENFRNNFYTDPSLNVVVDAFEENSFNQWVPKTKMFMYHGTADITVPYQNSVDTYNNFIANGVNSSLVEFIPLESQTHSSGAIPYILDIFDKFENLK